MRRSTEKREECIDEVQPYSCGSDKLHGSLIIVRERFDGCVKPPLQDCTLPASGNVMDLVRALGRVVGAGRGVAQRDVGDGRGAGGISSEGMKGTLGSSQWQGKSIVSFAFSRIASLL